ncbi:hypothetical protein DPMN_105717 [Dreissena polymorpha]|uniref:Uncharacterized protein n=1 Tax=Dreissena polymorpha TaxID=45954 RepID=A0A9D4K3Q0_DREPO|nr:hypothetical protein DPMN_105717 [Dreissena polymorpha]
MGGRDGREGGRVLAGGGGPRARARAERSSLSCAARRSSLRARCYLLPRIAPSQRETTIDKRQIDSETERPRDRETERQKDRERS